MEKREIPNYIMENDLPCLNYIKGLQGEFGVDLFLKNYVGTYVALGMEWKTIASRCAEKCNALFTERSSPDKNVRMLILDNLSKEEARRARKFFTASNPFFGSEPKDDQVNAWVKKTMGKSSSCESCGAYYQSFNPNRDCCRVCPLSCRFANRMIDLEYALIRACVEDAAVLRMAVASGIDEKDFSSLYDLSVNDRSCAKPLLVNHTQILWKILLAHESKSLDSSALKATLERDFLTEILSWSGNSVNGLPGSVGVMLQEVMADSGRMPSGPDVIDEFIRVRDEESEFATLSDDVPYAHFEVSAPKENKVNGNGIWEPSDVQELASAAESVEVVGLPVEQGDSRPFDAGDVPAILNDGGDPSASPKEVDCAAGEDAPCDENADGSADSAEGENVSEGAVMEDPSGLSADGADNGARAPKEAANASPKSTALPVPYAAPSGEVYPFENSLVSVPCISRVELCRFATCLDTAGPATLDSFVNSLTGGLRPCKPPVKAALNIEMVSVGEGDYVYLMYVPNMGRYFYTSLRRGDVRQVMADAFRFSGLAKYCYMPFLLVSSLKMSGIEVFKNIHSIYAVSSVLMPRHELSMKDCLEELGAVTWHGCADMDPVSFIIRYLHCFNRIYKNRLLKIRTAGLLRVLDEVEHYDEVLSYSFLHRKASGGVECLFNLTGSLSKAFPSTTCADFSGKACWCYHGDPARPETSVVFREMMFTLHDERVIRKTGAVILSMGANFVTFLVDKKKEGLLRERVLIAIEDSASRHGFKYFDYKRTQILEGQRIAPAER